MTPFWSQSNWQLMRVSETVCPYIAPGQLVIITHKSTSKLLH
jgi:hypothetical protein